MGPDGRHRPARADRPRRHSAGCGVSPNGQRIVSASDDGTVRLWEPASGDDPVVLAGHDGPVLG
ncbi:MAG: hypothetical protein ACRD0K_14545, partial [Egibacteraceae bacterium]